MGCGGDDTQSAPEGLGEADTEEIETVLDSAFVNSDPADCAEIYTEKALDQAVTLETDDLVAACEEDIEQAKGSGDADAIEVTELEGTPPEATATVTFDGGDLNGASATLALIDDDGWRIDELTDVEVEDLASVAEGQRESLKSLGFVDKSSSECLLGYLENEVGVEEFERSVVEGKQDYIFDSARLCLGGGSDAVALTLIVNEQLLDAGLPKGQANCVAAFVLAELDGVTLEDIVTDPEAKKEYERSALKGAKDCVGLGF